MGVGGSAPAARQGRPNPAPGRAASFKSVRKPDNVAQALLSWPTRATSGLEWLAGHRLRLFRRGSTLIPKSGASVNLNHRAKLATDGYVVSHLAVVTPDHSRLDPDYLYWWSVQYDPRSQAQVTSLPSLKLTVLKQAQITVPPLDEQQRIVAVLNRAARIERLRAQAAERLRQFVPALFVKMFGDPVDNPMRWRRENFGAMVEEFRYGTSGKCTTDQQTGDLPVLRIPNVLDGVVNWDDLKFRGFECKEAETLRLRVGDILFVRTNGNPNYIGRCAVYDSSRPAAYASYLIRARLSDQRVRPRYLADALALPSMRQKLLRLARTTAGNYNISIRSLASLSLPLPAFEHQVQYERLADKVRASSLRGEVAAKKATNLSSSMMAKLLLAPETR